MGDIPQRPRHGGFAPLYPPVFARPRLLMVCQRFESHSVVGLQGLAAYPLFLFWGHIPQGPLHPQFFPTLVCWEYAVP